MSKLPAQEELAPRPFLKWAGGKTQLLPLLLPHFPKKFKTYYEPFVGAGAVFFALAHERRFDRAVLSDSNAELMGCYRAVRGETGTLMGLLAEMSDLYEQRPASYYAEMRAARNDFDTEPEPWFTIAARMIFLNKAGYNGLYRVNKRGEFNVPWGKKKKVVAFDPANLSRCADALNRFVLLHTGSVFDASPEHPGDGDVCYLDSPYPPASKTANFAAYDKAGFTHENHKSLSLVAHEWLRCGATVIVSNADVPLIRWLYSDKRWKIHRATARRNINSKGEKRGPVGELIIVGKP